MREKLNLLLEKHCVTIKNHVEHLGELLKQAQREDTASLEKIREASALGHQLKGSSGTAGFHDICAAATTLYDLLKDLSARDEAPAQQELHHAIELHEALSGAAQSASPQTSALYLA